MAPIFKYFKLLLLNKIKIKNKIALTLPWKTPKGIFNKLLIPVVIDVNGSIPICDIRHVETPIAIIIFPIKEIIASLIENLNFILSSFQKYYTYFLIFEFYFQNMKNYLKNEIVS